MNKVCDFFKKIKWYEYLFIVIIFALMITISIIFESSVAIVFNSLIGVIYACSSAKGFVFANIFGMMQMILYSIISFENQYYGEIFICAFKFVISFVTLVLWFKNKSKNSAIVKVGKPLGWQEWLIMLLSVAGLSVGFYFVLGLLNTESLIVSTISLASSACAGYLMARRSEYGFVFHILNNIIRFVLWLMIVLGGQLNYLPTLLNYLIFLSINLIGLVNWIKMRKQQKVEQEVKIET